MRLDDDDMDMYSDDYADVDVILSHFGKKVSEKEAIAAFDECDGDADAAIIKLEKKIAASRISKNQHAPSNKSPPGQARTSSAGQTGKFNKEESSTDSTTRATAPSSLAELARRRLETSKNVTGKPAPKPVSGGLQSFLKSKPGAQPALIKSVGKNSPPSENDTAGGISATALDRFRAKKLSRPSPNLSTKAVQEDDNDPLDEQPVAHLQVEFKVPVTVRPVPSRLGNLLGKQALAPRYSTAVANTVSINKNATHTFTADSPDDVVLKAQKQAFQPRNKQPKVEQPKAEPPKVQAPMQVPQKTELLKKLQTVSLKPHISFVVIGHVDAGKSTLMGRILCDSGNISTRETEKYERDSAKIGKSSFALAWVMDSTKEERERGVTVDVGDAHFETEKAHFTVLDAPGHRDYVPNMIAGVSQADVAVLVVDADTNAFESGFSMDGQTREHALLARSLGIDQIIVAVNKMDTQDWSEERFDEIKTPLTYFLTKQVGYSASKILYIALSGRSGDFVYRRVESPKAQWYKGPTLIEALENIDTRPREISAAFQFVVSNVFQDQFSSSTSISGRVISGLVERGDAIANVSEAMVNATVKSLVIPRLSGDIERAHAAAGDIVELRTDMPLDKCRPGDVLASPDTNLSLVKRVRAKTLFFGLQKPILQGTRVSLYAGRLNISAKLRKVITILDKEGKPSSRAPKHVLATQTAIIELNFDRPQVLVPYTESKDLGRFVLRLDGRTIAGGVIVETKLDA